MTSFMTSLRYQGVPCYKHFYSYIISCNQRLNVLLIKSIIDKFVDDINDFVCISIVGGHPFLCHGTEYYSFLFVVSQIWNSIFNMFCSLSRYH